MPKKKKNTHAGVESGQYLSPVRTNSYPLSTFVRLLALASTRTPPPGPPPRTASALRRGTAHHRPLGGSSAQSIALVPLLSLASSLTRLARARRSARSIIFVAWRAHTTHCIFFLTNKETQRPVLFFTRVITRYLYVQHQPCPYHHKDAKNYSKFSVAHRTSKSYKMVISTK